MIDDQELNMARKQNRWDQNTVKNGANHDAMPANSHACGLKTSISRRLTLAGQFLTPDWKMWVVAVLLDTFSKNMLTQTHVRNENHV